MKSNKSTTMKKYIIVLMSVLATFSFAYAQEDPYLWLEEVDGQEALEFVEKHNATTLEELSAHEDYQFIFDKSLAIYNSTEQIVYPTIRGNYVYNFWQDSIHVRGIYRRCPIETYKNGIPVWETLIDIDALSEQDSVKWVYNGSDALYPDYSRLLVYLSKGGADASVIREFDVNKKEFITDGFFIDESKGSASFLDDNTLIVASDFGEGTLTTSGYPRQVKKWSRGTLLEDAELIFEIDSTDVSVGAYNLRDGSKDYVFISQSPTFFTSNSFVLVDDDVVKLDIPGDAQVLGILKDQLIIQLKSDWTVNGHSYNIGTLISLDLPQLLKGQKNTQIILEPDKYSSISSVSTTKNKLLVGLKSNVIDQLYSFSFRQGIWNGENIDAPDQGTIYIGHTDDQSDQFYFTFENFVTPTTLFWADASTNTYRPHHTLPAYFDASEFEVKQFKTESKDGTMIPYFMVASKDQKMDGNNPTLIFAYGGFEISMEPFYSGTFGSGWLDKGGVFVLANIRGGAEYGPKWHQAGLKEKRQNVFDDLYAVTEDLIDKKISSPQHLGVWGGSNGGLLVGVAFTQRPDLYNAVVCQVPLLDMKRYNKLLAGASWMDEYGNPDIPEEWEYIKKYSPYHNLKKGVSYPEVYFSTSTRDDRVHPGHARKMVAKMNDMGYKTYYYENTEGGHGLSSTNEQYAKSSALTFSYLLTKLKGAP